jgi:hypothetical protein
MRRLCLIMMMSALLVGFAIANCRAEPADPEDTTLSDYLHSQRLPLVEARMVTDADGYRAILLYGYVATPFGKRDAEDKVRDFMDDPDIEVTNRIRVTPELLTLGHDNNSEAAAADDNGADESADDAEQTAGQTYGNYPDDLAGREAYENQEREDALLQANGLGGAYGLPLIITMMGSGSIVPPSAPPFVYGPTYSTQLPPTFNRPPIIISNPPVTVFRPPSFGRPPTTFGSFPTAMGPNYYPSRFPAGPSPMFPATGGMPYPTAGPGFNSFAPHGFPSGFPSGGFSGRGFSGGFGFGGHR